MSLGIPRRHIHIVGCSPRSGTTLLHQMMISCFVVDESSAHEESAFKVFSEADLYCSKNPNEVSAVSYLLKVNPDFFCIYLLRDPRDVIVSEHSKSKGAYFSNLRIWKEYSLRAMRMVDQPRFLVVKYEDMVRDPDFVQRQIIRNFGFLEMKKPFSDFHTDGKVSKESEAAMGGLRAVKPSSVGRWRDHAQRIADQLSLHGNIDEELAFWGYEKSDDWKVGLPVAASHPPDSFIPDRISVYKRFKKRYSTFRKVIFYWLRLRCPWVYVRIKGDVKSR